MGLVIVVLLTMAIGSMALPFKSAVPAAHAWVINGQEQPLIPFWYTLCEAVKAYMIGDGSPDSCSATE